MKGKNLGVILPSMELLVLPDSFNSGRATRAHQLLRYTTFSIILVAGVLSC